MSASITIRERRGGTYEAWRDRRLLCASRQPLLAAARILLAEGANPNERIIMRREGSAADCLSATIGAAAKLTVDEIGGTRFARWKPFQRSAVGPYSRFPATDGLEAVEAAE